MKKVVSAFLNIFYIMLNCIFIVTSVLVPFYFSIISLTEPKTLATVIQNIDYKEVVERNPTIKSMLKKYGVDEEKADSIMKSKEAGELIEIYADETTEILLDIPDDSIFNVKLVKGLIDDNIDKALMIAEDTTGVNLKEKKIKKTINTYIKNNEKNLEKYAPALEQAHTVVKQIKASRVIQRTLTPQFIIPFSAIVLIMVGAICVLKRHNFKGFLFIGIDFAIISAFLGLVILFAKSSFMKQLAFKVSDYGTKIIESAVTICTDKLIIAIIGTILFTFIFIVFYIILCYVKHKYTVKTVASSTT